MLTANRARYIDSDDSQDAKGFLRVETTRWTVDGPFHVHEFRMIQEAETIARFIRIEFFVEHRIDSVLVGCFAWGHGTVDAYRSSQSYKKVGDGWNVELIAANVLCADLPCCGGGFEVFNKVADYATLQQGKCKGCGKRWDLINGTRFVGM